MRRVAVVSVRTVALRCSPPACRSLASAGTVDALFQGPPSWSLQDVAGASVSASTTEATAADAPQLSDADVMHMADLAHLHVPPEAVPSVKAELEQVLASMHHVHGVAQRAGGAVDAVDAGRQRVLTDDDLREDAVTEGGDADAVLRNAARTQSGYFVVERVIGDGGSET